MPIVRLGHSPYISIMYATPSKSGKTHIWDVIDHRDGSFCGLIRWHGPWRGYVFESESAVLPEGHVAFYDEKFLKQVSDFIVAANGAHKTDPTSLPGLEDAR